MIPVPPSPPGGFCRSLPIVAPRFQEKTCSWMKYSKESTEKVIGRLLCSPTCQGSNFVPVCGNVFESSGVTCEVLRGFFDLRIFLCSQ